MLIGLPLLSSCGVDFYHGRRPVDYPNTRWVSQEPDMFFEVGASDYAQIIIDGDIIKIN